MTRPLETAAVPIGGHITVKKQKKTKKKSFCCPPVVGKTNKCRQDSREDVYNSCKTHLSLRVCVLKFHVLVKFSFGQQIEQHQVTDHRRLEDI